jgi:hypothetical protein
MLESTISERGLGVATVVDRKWPRIRSIQLSAILGYSGKESDPRLALGGRGNSTSRFTDETLSITRTIGSANSPRQLAEVILADRPAYAQQMDVEFNMATFQITLLRRHEQLELGTPILLERVRSVTDLAFN